MFDLDYVKHLLGLFDSPVWLTWCVYDCVVCSLPQDLDMLHDVEVLGRSLVEALEPKLKQSGASARAPTICFQRISENELQEKTQITVIHWENKYCHIKLRTGTDRYSTFFDLHWLHSIELLVRLAWRNFHYFLPWQALDGKMWSCVALARALGWPYMQHSWSWSHSRWGSAVLKRLSFVKIGESTLICREIGSKFQTTSCVDPPRSIFTFPGPEGVCDDLLQSNCAWDAKWTPSHRNRCPAYCYPPS